jgi:hypothetical protein
MSLTMHQFMNPPWWSRIWAQLFLKNITIPKPAPAFYFGNTPARAVARVKLQLDSVLIPFVLISIYLIFISLVFNTGNAPVAPVAVAPISAPAPAPAPAPVSPPAPAPAPPVWHNVSALQKQLIITTEIIEQQSKQMIELEERLVQYSNLLAQQQSPHIETVDPVEFLAPKSYAPHEPSEIAAQKSYSSPFQPTYQTQITCSMSRTNSSPQWDEKVNEFNTYILTEQKKYEQSEMYRLDQEIKKAIAQSRFYKKYDRYSEMGKSNSRYEGA